MAAAECRPWAALDPTRIVVWTIVLGTIARLIVAVALGYGYGEGYYVATARHFDLSYFDQPPLSLWLAWVQIKLFGAQWPVLVRLPFIVMFAGTTWAMYRLGARLFDARAGAWGAVLLNLSPVFSLSVASWLQPDGPLMLLLLLAALPVVSLVFDEPKRPMRLWALAGAAFGLALLSKYHAVLILVGLVIFVATTPKHRAWFFSRGLPLAGAIAAILILPVLLWNAQNDWASVRFQGDRFFNYTGLHFDWLVRGILGQAALVNFVIWVPMMVVFFRALRAGPRDARAWFLCCLAIVPIIVFTAASLWAPLGYHFHWQSPGYLFLFPLLGRFAAEGIDAGLVATRRGVLGAGVYIAIGVVFLASQATTGWVRSVMPAAVTGKLEEAANPTRELLTWNEVRQVVAAHGLLDTPKMFAVGPQWHQTGKVDVQLGDKMPVVCLCRDPRNIAFGWNPKAFLGWDALIVGTDHYIPDVQTAYGPYFRSIELLDTAVVTLGGRPDLTVRIYLAHDYERPYPLPYGPGRPDPGAGG
jgi:hypothetical protein